MGCDFVFLLLVLYHNPIACYKCGKTDHQVRDWEIKWRMERAEAKKRERGIFYGGFLGSNSEETNEEEVDEIELMQIGDSDMENEYNIAEVRVNRGKRNYHMVRACSGRETGRKQSSFH
ncbi:uncharacterized protein LOC124895699 [Capsicum annuum]|uniref:uncharacterized protein LOC124895699 n=1 Tax=Capsicum annuum TaxID=4072 RepID=UPI001FB0C1D7|nr:uncharacterized protein LOC124895699 [Capsicum annuum]